MPLGFRPLSTAPLSSYAGAAGAAETIILTRRFASRSLTTRATNSPAHQYIPGWLARNLTLGRRLNQAEDGQFGSLIEAVHGEVELDNCEGQLDDLVHDFRADGRLVTLKIGATELTSLGRERIQPYNLFETVYRTVAEDFYFEKNVVRLALASQNKRLEDRLQLQVYAGTGGIGGTAEMTGRTRPTALGRCLNVTPQILDPAIVTYDLHAGPVSSVEAVYDMGVEMPFSADYPTYNALIAASVPAGSYATSIAAGKMRLGFQPAGDVTVDLRGDIDNSNGSYVGQHASILRMVLRDYAGFTNAELDLDSFIDVNAVQTFEMGLFLPAGDQSTVIDVAQQIAFSCGAFVGQDRSGLLRMQRLEVPATQPHWIFTDRDIVEDRFEAIRLPYRIPWKAWGCGYSAQLDRADWRPVGRRRDAEPAHVSGERISLCLRVGSDHRAGASDQQRRTSAAGALSVGARGPGRGRALAGALRLRPGDVSVHGEDSAVLGRTRPDGADYPGSLRPGCRQEFRGGRHPRRCRQRDDRDKCIRLNRRRDDRRSRLQPPE